MSIDRGIILELSLYECPVFLIVRTLWYYGAEDHLEKVYDINSYR